jgi:phosphotransferase system  glucose/maltose/N-acetylglucosamine-specific IIC component
MARYDLPFLIAALLCAVAGMAMGIVMGILHDFSLSPVHAHLNLVGFLALAVYGLIYRGWPELSASSLAPVQFWTAVIGALLLPIGIGISIKLGQPGVAIAGSLVAVASPVVLTAMLVALARRARALA